MRPSSLVRSLVAAALALAAPAHADLRISELEVFLNDHEVTVQVVLLAYNVVTKEFKVMTLQGDTRPEHTARQSDDRTIQRVQ